MSLNKTITYNNAANFTFDSEFVEVGSVAALRELVDIEEVFYANFATKDLLRAVGGSLTGTLGASATIASGQLQMPNATATWSIDPSGKLPGVGVGGASNIFTIRFKVTPQYTGSPASNQYFYEEKLNSGANRVWIYHNTAGNLAIEFRSSTGAGQGTLSSAWSPTAGTEYEIELNVNRTKVLKKFILMAFN